jgi:hypothetical protein
MKLSIRILDDTRRLQEDLVDRRAVAKRKVGEVLPAEAIDGAAGLRQESVAGGVEALPCTHDVHALQLLEHRRGGRRCGGRRCAAAGPSGLCQYLGLVGGRGGQGKEKRNGGSHARASMTSHVKTSDDGFDARPLRALAPADRVRRSENQMRGGPRLRGEAASLSTLAEANSIAK